MTVNHQELSLSLYNYLCKVVGSEDVVRTRRRLVNATEYVNHSKDYSCICSGSKAEGLDLSESDLDLMIIVNSVSVYEKIECLSNRTHNWHITVPIIMDTVDTKPGYTRLKLYNINDTQLYLGSFCYTIGHEVFLSSTLFREYFTIDGIFSHGPCRSSPSGLLDVVHSFRCKNWILQAKEWIYRSRLSWPHTILVETIVQSGVFFVPIGCKSSPQRDLEFRISFNVAEKILIHSFSHVQLFCYALLKIILTHFIKPQHGDLLCSYFLKTIMFWVSEESMESIWQPHNLIRCFDLCFKRLVWCVTYSNCLHYFIPELDLFEDRFSKSEHDSLTSTIISLYNSGWQCVLHTNLLSSFNFVIHQSSARVVSSALQSFWFTIVHSRLYAADDKSLMTVFSRSVFGSKHLHGKQIYALILSQVMSATNFRINEAHDTTNKQKYQNYRKCLCYRLQGLHHDAVSGWLLLASFFYTSKQYQQCLHVLNYCLHKCTPDKILLGMFIDTELQHEFNIEMQQYVKNSFLSTCKRRVVDYVHVLKQSSIIPAELSEVLEKEYASFPPVVFAHFLHCICLHRLNRNRDKVNALRDLETTVRDMYFIQDNAYQTGISCLCIELARKLIS